MHDIGHDACCFLNPQLKTTLNHSKCVSVINLTSFTLISILFAFASRIIESNVSMLHHMFYTLTQKRASRVAHRFNSHFIYEMLLCNEDNINAATIEKANLLSHDMSRR